MSAAWALVPLGDLLRSISRAEPIDPDVTYRLLGAHWYGKGLYVKSIRPGSEIRAMRVYRVEKGDFVYNRLFAWKGSFAIATAENHGCYVSNEFPCFAVDTNLLEDQYLRWYFTQPSAWQEALGLSAGGTPTSRNRLKEEKLLGMRIPFPPLSEQRQIATRIEQLAAKIDEARRFRQDAVTEVEAAEVAGQVEVLKTIAGAPHLPIESLAEVRGGIQKGPHRAPGDNPVRYLTVAHVHRDRISLADPRFFEVTSQELERWQLEAGDVLIIEGNGSPDQIGRTALFRGEIRNCVHQNHVIRIRPDRKQVEPEFLNTYLNSPLGQEEVQARGRTTSGLLSLSVGRIKEIEIPVPPLMEQRTVVARVEELRVRVDAVRRLQVETTGELDALLPSALNKAFKGELG